MRRSFKARTLLARARVSDDKIISSVPIKVASTSAIFLRFEAEFKWREFTAYERLSILKKKGCLDTRSDASGSFRVWTLTAKGFKAIQHLLLPLFHHRKEIGNQWRQEAPAVAPKRRSQNAVDSR